MSVEQTGICIIANNRITVDERVVFEQTRNLNFTDFAKAAFKHLDLTYPKFYKMDRLCKLGFLAAEYLIAENPDCRPDESTAIILSNSSGSLDSDLAHLKNAEQPSPAVFVYTLPNIVAGEIAIRHGMKGETAFFICENENDPTAQQYAANLLINGMAHSCIVGWVDFTEEQYLARLCFLRLIS